MVSPEKRKRLARLHHLGHSSRSIATMLEIGKGTVAREVRRLRLAAA